MATKKKTVETAPEAEEAQPKRRTRRTAKAKAEAETPEKDSATEAGEGAKAEAKKPARTTRTRKSTKVAAEDKSEKPEKPEKAESADDSGKSKAKPASDKPDKSEKAERDDKQQGNNDGGRGQRNNQRNQRNNQRHNRRQRNAPVEPSVTREELQALKVAELRERAGLLDVDWAGLKKAELVEAVYDASVKAEGFLDVAGILDILSDGYGFLRTTGYLPGETDCYVGMSLIKRNGLRKGDYIEGSTRPARDNEKFAAIQKITAVNGIPSDQLDRRPKFADLTPVYPQERLVMEHGKNTTTARVIDLVAPIGKGQRGLIVSPPKAGKTTILKDIAAAISANNPEVHLMCLLVDERPEEVTDMQRSIRGEVVSSTFDMPADNHIAVAEMVIERAKRLVEAGRDVVILLDSITRLARAYNLAQPASGRVLSGGVDSTALYPPKRFLGAARNIENGGSLTILASALIETGSKMDEVIFEEFKGTGNMELRLDRQLADRRIFPAIDPVTSGTRKEELLLDQQMSPIIWAVRRILANMNNTERAMDTLIKSIKQTDDNNEFLLRMARKAQHGSKGESLEL
ncbi:MAG: transcription termination factor Rho [Eggerthellaceae bacterium]|nr:transcription termination factor Rho [Eggerthellaceae bacterium]